ncbi:AI-2E family transporter [Microlunatus sp. Gsoil 973]|uniref:AI-2E family transporter n=1 Tax=Microlunatus sp. Gsoil 973 TaxID=2672569 RepID=UPI002104C71A|nr:AI-2E family transporter [Microlunatus sp. Gsoil 973]
MVVAAGFVVLCAGLREVSNMIGPAFLVITLVITFQPVRNFLIKRRVPGWIASVVVLLLIFLMMLMILGAVALSVTQLVQELPRYAAAFQNMYDYGLDTAKKLGINTSDWRNLLSKIDVGRVTDAAQRLLSGVSSGFSLGGLIALTAIFFTFDAASASKRLRRVRRMRPNVAAAFADFAGRVRQYWIVTTVFGLIVASVDVVALYIIGVPLAVTWGILAFVTNYIPNIGFIIGLIPPALIALLEKGPWHALAVVIAYVVINFVIQTLIQPRFVGDAAGINASVAFVSLIFWSSILGVLGALLAVPATLFVKCILVDHSERASWFGFLINSASFQSKKQPQRPRRPRHRPTEVGEQATDAEAATPAAPG